MGGASSGGGDNQVSGAEAVTTGGTTYSSRKTKDINKEIAAQNKKNRESRKGLIQKVAENTLWGKLSKSEWSKQRNLKSRKLWMKQNPGKFKDVGQYTDEFIGSTGFKTQIDAMGYSDRNKVAGDRDYTPLKKVSTGEIASGSSVVASAPSKAEIDQASATTLSGDQILVANKKKGKSSTIITDPQGLGKNNLITKKKTLGA